MLRRIALIRTDVSEDLSASIIRVTRIGELGTTLAVTNNRRRLVRNTKWCSVRRFLVRASVVPSSPILVTLMKVPPKRLFLQEPHGITSRKTPFFFTLFSSRIATVLYSQYQHVSGPIVHFWLHHNVIRDVKCYEFCFLAQVKTMNLRWMNMYLHIFVRGQLQTQMNRILPFEYFMIFVNIKLQHPLAHHLLVRVTSSAVLRAAHLSIKPSHSYND
jgi:hypothetical protein